MRKWTLRQKGWVQFAHEVTSLRSVTSALIEGARVRGVALVAVLVVFITASIMAAALLVFASNQFRVTNRQINRTRAFYLAEAGVQLAFSNLQKGLTPASTTYTIDGTSVVVQIVSYNSNTYEISSTVQY